MTFKTFNQKSLGEARHSARHIARFANAACNLQNPRWEDSALTYFRILRGLRARFEVTESTEPAEPLPESL
jgi:hypothetical protein